MSDISKAREEWDIRHRAYHDQIKNIETECELKVKAIRAEYNLKIQSIEEAARNEPWPGTADIVAKYKGWKGAVWDSKEGWMESK